MYILISTMYGNKKMDTVTSRAQTLNQTKQNFILYDKVHDHLVCRHHPALLHVLQFL